MRLPVSSPWLSRPDSLAARGSGVSAHLWCGLVDGRGPGRICWVVADSDFRCGRPGLPCSRYPQVVSGGVAPRYYSNMRSIERCVARGCVMTGTDLSAWSGVDLDRISLVELLDLVERSDPRTASEERCLGVVAAGERIIRWLHAIQSRFLNRAADRAAAVVAGTGAGYDAIDEVESVSTELAVAVGLSRRSATDRVGDSVLLCRELPAILELVEQGRLEWRTAVSVHTQMRSCLQPGTAQWEAVAAALAAALPGRTHRQAIAAAQRAVQSVDPQAARRRHDQAVRERCVRVFPLPDGMAGIDVRLRADVAVMVDAVLDALADGYRDAAARVGNRDLRSHQERRADAFAAVFRAVEEQTSGGSVVARRMPGKRSRKAHLVVTVSLDTLLGCDDLPGALSRFGAIPADLAREIARQAGRITVVPVQRAGGGQGSHPGPHVPGDQRNCFRAGAPYRPRQAVLGQVVGRFPECVHPGCARPAAQCDVDHVVPYAKGGRSCECKNPWWMGTTPDPTRRTVPIRCCGLAFAARATWLRGTQSVARNGGVALVGIGGGAGRGRFGPASRQFRADHGGFGSGGPAHSRCQGAGASAGLGA